MSLIFITGSPDGLGKWQLNHLLQIHKVVLHARDKRRANDAMLATPGADGAVTGDLSSIKETIQVVGR
ncbi:MAG: hypothetical protein ABI863_22580 [Ginsengibacter sp.]